MKGITFGNYHSYDDFSLLLASKEIGEAVQKIVQIDVPGADGVLDYTEYFGDVKFENRNLKFEFSTIVPQAQFLTLYSKIQNAIHGKKYHIILNDDASFFYVGRIKVSAFTNSKNIGHITIECDCEPYKYKMNQTVVSKTITELTVITLKNSRKKVVPTIKTTSEMTFSFGGRSITVAAGTFIIPELELIEGNNFVTVEGVGTVTFTYQEGQL